MQICVDVSEELFLVMFGFSKLRCFHYREILALFRFRPFLRVTETHASANMFHNTRY